MPTIPIRSLITGGGVNRDQQANSLPMNAFSEIANGRMRAGRLERFGDTEVYQDSTSDYELVESRALFNIVRNGQEGLLLITATGIYIDVGSGWVDFTPSYISLSDSSTWTMEQYGDWICIQSLENDPLVLDPAGIEFENFVDWPANYRCARVFFYKNVAIAVGIEISAEAQNGLVIWSDVILDNDLANVEWDNLTTNLAGENILPDSSGLILEGGVLRDSAILYTDTTVWRMDFTSATAGSTNLVFNFRRIFGDDGILAPRCWTEVAGFHYVIGVNNIYMHDGFNRTYVSDQRVNDFFYANLGNQAFAFITHYARPQEVVFAYATSSFTQANEALVWNYKFKSWTRWVWSEDEGFFRYLPVGPDFDQEVPSWSTLTGTWNDYANTPWASLFPNIRTRTPYGLNIAEDTIYQMDQDTEEVYNQTPFTFVIERKDLDFDEVFQQNIGMRHIKRILPLVTGTGSFTVRVGGRNNLADDIVYGDPQTFTIGTDYKIDVRETYRFPAIRFEQDSTQGKMSLSGYDIVVKHVSMR